MRVDEQDEAQNRRASGQAANGNQIRPTRISGVVAAIVAVLILAVVVIRGLRTRAETENMVRDQTNQLAAPAVSIMQPRLEDHPQEIVLPASIQAYTSAPIYARTSGYLKKWYADIGTHVKKGELLAEIATPEVDQQLHEARANLATAQANLRLSEITAKRYSGLLKSDSVSQQSTDTAVGGYEANKATVQADEAHVRELEALQSFQKIYAPFSGVITARNTDIGQLIDAGSSAGPGKELFDIAAIGVLRVYINVPQVDSNLVHRGLAVDLTLPEFANRRFQGTLVHTADAIDPASRTLLVEVDVNNASGQLLPGAYAEAHFKIPANKSVCLLPVTTLIFRSAGLQVATVNSDRKVVLKSIQLGRDFGTVVEVVSGITPDDQVIVNPPDSLVSGETVRPVTPAAVGGQS
jgi:RND family efflux transporter MFP subunit